MNEQPQYSELVLSTQEEIENELFRILHESLSEWSDSVPQNLKFLEAGRDQLEYEQIGEEEGFVNFIFRIKERPAQSSDGGGQQQSVVVKWSRMIPRFAEKQKLQFKRDEGGGKVLSDQEILQRNTKESEALARVEGIVPGSTPQIFWVDPERYFFIMEDLREHLTLRQQLTRGEVVPEAFQTIATILSTLHRSTHVKVLGKEEFDKFAASLFRNPIIDKISAGFFDHVFKSEGPMAMMRAKREHSEPMKKVMPEIIDNEEISQVLQRLKDSFLNVHVCYLQNDSHPGSFMINAEGDVRMLDLEFATVGNTAKEVGYFLGEIVMFYYIYRGRGQPELSERIRSTASAFVKKYLDRMGDCVDDNETFMRYLAGHCGHFAGLRTVGMAMAYPQFAGLEQAEADSLRAVIRLLKGMDDITTLEKFIAVAFE